MVAERTKVSGMQLASRLVKRKAQSLFKRATGSFNALTQEYKGFQSTETARRFLHTLHDKVDAKKLCHSAAKFVGDYGKHGVVAAMAGTALMGDHHFIPDIQFGGAHLWGDKTNSFFDPWSIEHYLSGIAIGSAILNRTKPSDGGKTYPLSNYALLAGIAFGWESTEHYIETGLLGDWWQYWFHGIEFWGNRLVTDPLMLILGYETAKCKPGSILPAKVISTLWYATNILFFPHSMYIMTGNP